MTIADGRQPTPEKDPIYQAGGDGGAPAPPAASDDAGEAAAAAAAESELPPAEATAPDASPTLEEVRSSIDEVVTDRQVKVGDIVLYTVAESDEPNTRHNGAVILPAVVTAVWGPSCANLKIMTDGPVNTWKTSALRGSGPGNWSFRD
jgi:hypothetical protein